MFAAAQQRFLDMIPEIFEAAFKLAPNNKAQPFASTNEAAQQQQQEATAQELQTQQPQQNATAQQAQRRHKTRSQKKRIQGSTATKKASASRRLSTARLQHKRRHFSWVKATKTHCSKPASLAQPAAHRTHRISSGHHFECNKTAHHTLKGNTCNYRFFKPNSSVQHHATDSELSAQTPRCDSELPTREPAPDRTPGQRQNVPDPPAQLSNNGSLRIKGY